MHYLIDGYSLIHSRPELRKALCRRLAHARDLLIGQLQRYRDQSGEAVTVFFDGRSGPEPKPAKPKKARKETAIEIVFSAQGQSADTLIERRVGRAAAPANYLVVTADHGIETTVGALGATSISPDSFFEMLEHSEKEFTEWLEDHRVRAKRKFERG
jgi:predicted RNA-binding protein with PIN domain